MTSSLNTQANFHRAGVQPLRAYTPGDDFYDLLIEMHRGLSDDESRLVNARLILLLANHIGDLDVLREATQRARIHPASEPASEPAPVDQTKT